jgi:hypothetical protein
MEVQHINGFCNGSMVLREGDSTLSEQAVQCNEQKFLATVLRSCTACFMQR